MLSRLTPAASRRTVRSHRFQPALWLALSLMLVASLGAAPAAAQSGNAPSGTPSRAVPSQAYFTHFQSLWDGDYSDALKLFQSDLSSAIKTSQNRWIDSICYYTMVGECYYKLGQLDKALDNYNAAANLYMQFPNWMMQVQFPANIQASAAVKNIPWGHSNRTARISHLPGIMQLAQGQLFLNAAQFQPNSTIVVAPASLFPVDVQEIARCTALAIKRRAELMGPVCPHDRLTADLIATLARPVAPPHHWSQAWVDCQLGMAYLGGGQPGQAIGYLKQSLNLGGEFDHRLTPLALLELGQIALEAGKFDDATMLFEEASYSAVEFNDMTVLEEAFRGGQQAFLLKGGAGMFPPLATAIGWSKSKGLELRTSLLLSAAECQALMNQPAAALTTLGDVKHEIDRQKMKNSEIGSRFHYLAALCEYQKGDVKGGDSDVDTALDFQKHGSKWLFQIALADYYVHSQSGPRLGAHRALGLYEVLLRDPAGADWAARPLESLAVLTTPHPLVFEHWFDATRESGVELSLEVADRTRRHRFLTTLPFGGRLLALRWVLEAPADALDKPTLNQRQELLTRYPKYAELSKQVQKLRDELASAPLVATGIDAQRKQADRLAQIGNLSAEQELMLRELALRREAADMVFPPFRLTKDVQAALQPRQLLLVFFSTTDNTYGCLMSSQRYKLWKLESPAIIKSKTMALLKGIGNFDAAHEIPQSQLSDETWRVAGRDLTEALLAGSGVNLSDNIDELIIVPDGMLWYLPFEALQVSAGKAKDKSSHETITLLNKTRIRYAPTMGLAIPGPQGRRETAEIGVVLGRLHPKDEPAVVQAEFDKLNKVATHVWPINNPLPAASPLYGSLFDTLVVFDDLAVGEKGSSERAMTYDWSPIQMDRARTAGTLEKWFLLPWKSPAQIILPGFHTPAETSLKSLGSGPPGGDLFLTTCGLMSTGARTVLISRWRTGGQESYELIRQFTQELPFASAADAWQRSVQMAADTPLDLDREPRIKRVANADTVTAHHPFFWSGYLLIDTGWSPPKNEKPIPPQGVQLNANAAAAK